MANYDSKPSVLEAVGNGSYLYRYNIQERITDATESQQIEHETADEARISWECDEVVVWGPITANKVTKAVIASRWENNYEQKLINEYNAAQLGVYDDSVAQTKIEAYKAFLTERQALKAQVDADCEVLGVN